MQHTTCVFWIWYVQEHASVITCISHPGLCQWFLVILIQLTACTVHVGADFVWKGSITNESQFQNSVNTLEIFTWCCTNFSWRQIRKHLLMTLTMKIMIIMRRKLRNRKINMSKPTPQCSFGRAILLLLKLRMIINIICPTLPLPHMNYRHKPQMITNILFLYYTECLREITSNNIKKQQV